MSVLNPSSFLGKKSNIHNFAKTLENANSQSPKKRKVEVIVDQNIKNKFKEIMSVLYEFPTLMSKGELLFDLKSIRDKIKDDPQIKNTQEFQVFSKTIDIPTTKICLKDQDTAWATTSVLSLQSEFVQRKLLSWNNNTESLELELNDLDYTEFNKLYEYLKNPQFDESEVDKLYFLAKHTHYLQANSIFNKTFRKICINLQMEVSAGKDHNFPGDIVRNLYQLVNLDPDQQQHLDTYISTFLFNSLHRDDQGLFKEVTDFIKRYANNPFSLSLIDTNYSQSYKDKFCLLAFSTISEKVELRFLNISACKHLNINIFDYLKLSKETLENINLAKNNWVDDTCVEKLSIFSNLKTLSLASTKITARVFSHLPKSLEILDLSHYQGECPNDMLLDCKNLRYLFLKSSKIVTHHLANLTQNIEYLNLRDCTKLSLDSGLVQHLQKLTKLKEIIVSKALGGLKSRLNNVTVCS